VGLMSSLSRPQLAAVGAWRPNSPVAPGVDLCPCTGQGSGFLRFGCGTDVSAVWVRLTVSVLFGPFMGLDFGCGVVCH
jgi:hypothetical protein